MKYIAIEGDERIFIVNEGCYIITRKINENLKGNELKIRLLKAKDCPISQSCISIDNDCSSICKHLGSYPLVENDKNAFGKPLRCKRDKKIHKDTLLFVDECPDKIIDESHSYKNCIDCDKLKHIETNPTIHDKSHCHIVCSQVEITE